MNVSVRKKHLTRIGGFDEHFRGYGCEDTDVGYRLWKEGLQFIVDPSLKNYHQEHLRNAEKQEAERITNMQYMVKKHKTAEMALYEGVPVGDMHRKSAFMFDRDRLLSEGIVSNGFVSQLNGLIWRCARQRYPGIGAAAARFDKLNDRIFWTELDKVRGRPEYASSVEFAETLYAKTLDHYEL